jgi:hypothetical protein
VLVAAGAALRFNPHHNRMTQIGQVVFNFVVLRNDIETLSLERFIHQKKKKNCHYQTFGASIKAPVRDKSPVLFLLTGNWSNTRKKS